MPNIKNSIGNIDYKICYEYMCNQKINPQQCIHCNEANNKNCLENPQLERSVECDYYSDSCVTILQSDGIVIRDCVQNVLSSKLLKYEHVRSSYCMENPWFCYFCDAENNCNNNTEPGYCYECSSSTEPNCWHSLNDDMIAECPFSVEKPGCYYYKSLTGKKMTRNSANSLTHFFLFTDHHVFRGCMTTLEIDFIKLLKATGETIEICQTNGCNKQISHQQCSNCSQENKNVLIETSSSHGCNDQFLVRKAELSCVKCKDDTECAYGQNDAEKIERCENNVDFQKYETCFIRSFNETEIVERGCTLDSTEENLNWCLESENCKQCSEYGCNVANVKCHSCIECNSKINEECAILSNSSNYIQNYDCIEPYSYEQRGCFTMEEGIIYIHFNLNRSNDGIELAVSKIENKKIVIMNRKAQFIV